MGRSVEIVDHRIVSRRVGSVDWQDAMESFAMYGGLVEDTGVKELLMDMAEADVKIPEAEAPSLATMFLEEIPSTLALAVIVPNNQSGSRFIKAFMDQLTRDGRTVRAVKSAAEADRAFAMMSQDAEDKRAERKSVWDRLTKILPGKRDR